MKKLFFLALIGMVLLAGSAFADSIVTHGTQASVDPRFPNSTKTATANAEAVIVRNADLSISCIQDLLFGNIKASAAAGTITISPSGAKTATGGASAYSNTGNIAAAEFTVKGDANSMFTVALPGDGDCSLIATTNLADGHYQVKGSSMNVVSFTSNASNPSNLTQSSGSSSNNGNNSNGNNGNSGDGNNGNGNGNYTNNGNNGSESVVYFGANGEFDLKVGATLNVGASQLPGYYQGNFNVSVVYY